MIWKKQYSWGRDRSATESDRGPLRFLWFWMRRGAEASACLGRSVLKLLTPRSAANDPKAPPFETDETVDADGRSIQVLSENRVELGTSRVPITLPDKAIEPTARIFPLGAYRKAFDGKPAADAALAHYIVADQRPAFEQIEWLLGGRRKTDNSDWALIVDSRPKASGRAQP